MGNVCYNLLNCDLVNFFKLLTIFGIVTRDRAILSVRRMLIRMQKSSPDRNLSDNAVASHGLVLFVVFLSAN